jgi:sugar phosphate permease
LSALFVVFKNKPFRGAAFGYFGHMWELYAFWAFVPLMLSLYSATHQQYSLNIPLLSFFIIGVGGLGCIISGYLSLSYGAKKIAFIALLTSGLCCLFSPLFFFIDSPLLFIGLLLIWGMAVVADSPLFSTLVAHNTSAETKGTALTIVNCIGFAITIVSIQLLNGIKDHIDLRYSFVLLAIGPVFGLMALRSLKK